MKSSQLLNEIRQELKDYPIDYLRNKATDERYKDPLTKKLAKYNSEIYDEIFSLTSDNDHNINDSVVKNIKEDIDFYFNNYAGGDIETREFTKYISLYLALIAKKPLHPFSDSKKDDVYINDGKYYCKNKIKYIKEDKSLCRYCSCRNVGFMDLF